MLYVQALLYVQICTFAAPRPKSLFDIQCGFFYQSSPTRASSRALLHERGPLGCWKSPEQPAWYAGVRGRRTRPLKLDARARRADHVLPSSEGAGSSRADVSLETPGSTARRPATPTSAVREPKSQGSTSARVQTARVTAPTRGRLAAPRALPGRPVGAPGVAAPSPSRLVAWKFF